MLASDAILRFCVGKVLTQGCTTFKRGPDQRTTDIRRSYGKCTFITNTFAPVRSMTTSIFLPKTLKLSRNSS